MIKGLNNKEILSLLGERFKSYRLTLDLTQEKLGEIAGVSVSTIHKFETGTMTNMTLGNLIALLRQVGLIERLDELIPEMPVSPYSTLKNRQRVKKTIQ